MSEQPIVTSPLTRLRNLYRKKLRLGQDDLPVVDYIASTIAAVRLGEATELVWSWLKGPPGVGKTEICRPVMPLDYTQAIDTLTQNSLVSGLVDESGRDFSLIPELDGKLLIIKDFTAILRKDPKVLDAIMGQLRAIFDGSYTAAFGSKGLCPYTARFGIIACVTPEIDWIPSPNLNLGERFISLRIGRRLPPRNVRWKEDVKMLNRSGSKAVWRLELAQEMERLLLPIQKPIKDWAPPMLDPNSPETERLLSTADLVTRFRALPVKSRLSTPETPKRLLHQLHQMAGARAFLDDREDWSKEDFDLVVRVGYDSLPAEALAFLRALWKAGTISSDDLARRTNITYERVRAICNQYVESGLIIRRQKGTSWSLSKEAIYLLETSRLMEAAP